MSGKPIRPNDRYPGSRMPPRSKKPKTPDISHLHYYKDPGDKDGNGMFALTANTRAELIQKMIEHDHRPFEPTFTGTTTPGSPRVIERQGGYQVDQEPD